MTDYQPLIGRAVDGLAKNTGEARRALYERARAALVAQLRAVEPALSESDITKERLALEEAIRKVESEAARKALSEPRPSVRAEPRPEPRAAMPRPALSDRQPAAGRAEARKAEQPVADDGGAAPAAKLSARSRILGARSSPPKESSLREEGLKGFRNVVNEVDALGAASAKAAQTARDTRDSYVPGTRERAQPGEDFSPPPAEPERLEPDFGDAEWPAAEDSARDAQGHEPVHDLDDDEPAPLPRLARPLPPHDEDIEEDHYEEPPPLRSYRSWAKIALVALIVLGVAATGFEYRANIGAIYQFFTQMKSRPSTQAEQTPAAQSKFGGRVPQEQIGQTPAPSTGTPDTGTSPTGQDTQETPGVAQRAVLYEADPNDPQGKRFPGSVVWRTETVSPGPGLAPELVVHADITIPDRHMTVTWTLRRNTDKALPASHTIEVMFNLPPDFPGGGISNVPGILMKDSEEVRGMPLAGLAVKVTNGFFLLGLNSADADMQRNIQLLKERGWFDILIVYNNGSRAILTMEKGPPGEKAFSDAFAAWGQ
jgi:hypothetical protein